MFWNKWVQSAFFSNFSAESEKGHEGGGMAKAGQKEEEKG